MGCQYLREELAIFFQFEHLKPSESKQLLCPIQSSKLQLCVLSKVSESKQLLCPIQSSKLQPCVLWQVVKAQNSRLVSYDKQ